MKLLWVTGSEGEHPVAERGVSDAPACFVLCRSTHSPGLGPSWSAGAVGSRTCPREGPLCPNEFPFVTRTAPG